MSNKEAIEIIKTATSEVEWVYPMEYAAAFDMAISALKKLMPERPKRIITNKEVAGNFQCVCPSCGWLMFERVTTEDASEPVVCRIFNFCQSCGQRIDWGKARQQKKHLKGAEE